MSFDTRSHKRTTTVACRMRKRPVGLPVAAICVGALLSFVSNGKVPMTVQAFSSCHRLRQPSLSRSLNNRILKISSSMGDWEGDDIRWSARMRRRFQQSWTAPTRQPARDTILLLNISAFLYQSISTVNWIRKRHPAYWPSQAIPIVFDSIWGSSQLGPLAMDFCHSAAMSQVQPHRFLTSGFLHGGLLHLLVNMDALRRLPAWLETGLGSLLYVTAYLLSIVMGNLAHNLAALDGPASASLTWSLGASGGICGLYGLMYVSLVRMGNSQAASKVLRGIWSLMLYGFLFSNVDNAAHLGGLVGGVITGLICGPRYQKSYSLRRKWSLEVDVAPKDYRVAMGFGVKPSSSGLVPLPLLWLSALAVILSQPRLRSAPLLIWQGLVHPGSLYALIS